MTPSNAVFSGVAFALALLASGCIDVKVRLSDDRVVACLDMLDGYASGPNNMDRCLMFAKTSTGARR
jgi:hypothetical protein